VEEESHGRCERHFNVGRGAKQHFFLSFPGFARSSFPLALRERQNEENILSGREKEIAWGGRKIFRLRRPQTESIVEAQVKVKSHGSIERHLFVGREQRHNFFIRFLGFAHSSF
jgi:hypothetical protein